AFQKETRPSFATIRKSIEETGKTLLDIVAIAALAGLVIGSLQLSGLSFKLSLLLVTLAGGNAFLLLFFTAVVCIILGMGMPTAIIYVMLAVLVGPALTQLGIVPLAAHLFLFYFGMLSMITPPVCLATYAAASLARSDFWATGWAGARLGIVAYVVPFVFAFHPALILHGSPLDIVLAIGTAIIGVVLLGIGCAGYLFRPLTWIKRGSAAMAGLLLILPPTNGVGFMANSIAFASGMALVLWEWNGSTLERAPVAEPDSGKP
ncbi:MAG: TRAP transporter large permease subunit, partial [Deltaproteobacteria bacterium]|nr:TRAP transporter large permease subunit [Deltaproteobacteria bacterium]